MITAHLAEKLADQALPEFMGRSEREAPPDHASVYEIMRHLRSLMFPGYFSNAGPLQTLQSVERGLTAQLQRVVGSRSESLVGTFLSTLPEIREALAADTQAAYRGDPSAQSPEEVVLSFPGLLALAYHRAAHQLFLLKVPLIPRMIAERAHSLTGIDIHPGATIGPGLFIDHGTGVVIGATCRIGRDVRIYQGVTLGAKSFTLDANGDPIKNTQRHPIVEDRVVIYAGATVLGRVTLGEGAVVGGNVWLTRSLPPGARVSQGKNKLEGFRDGAGI